jgi:hypothetical protein
MSSIVYIIVNPSSGGNKGDKIMSDAWNPKPF